MRKQTVGPLVAFTFRMPIAFRVVHVGTLCMAFCTLSFRVVDACFLRVFGTGSPGRRGISSHGVPRCSIAVGRARGRSSSRLFIIAFSFAFGFQVCDSDALSLGAHGSELVSLAEACALLAFPLLTTDHQLHTIVATRSLTERTTCALISRYPLALVTFVDPMVWWSWRWSP